MAHIFVKHILTLSDMTLYGKSREPRDSDIKKLSHGGKGLSAKGALGWKSGLAGGEHICVEGACSPEEHGHREHEPGITSSWLYLELQQPGFLWPSSQCSSVGHQLAATARDCGESTLKPQARSVFSAGGLQHRISGVQWLRVWGCPLGIHGIPKG